MQEYWQSNLIRWPGDRPNQPPNKQAPDACPAAAHAFQQQVTALWQGVQTSQPAGAQLEGQLQELERLAGALAACRAQSTAFLRRYATAALLLTTQRAPDAWSPPCQRSAALVLLQLQLLHQHSAAERGVLEFTHISKSGGTSMCHLAQQAGCSTEAFKVERNCMVTVFGWVAMLTARPDPCC
jgi:hypothetical protein